MSVFSIEGQISRDISRDTWKCSP